MYVCLFVCLYVYYTYTYTYTYTFTFTFTYTYTYTFTYTYTYTFTYTYTSVRTDCRLSVQCFSMMASGPWRDEILGFSIVSSFNLALWCGIHNTD